MSLNRTDIARIARLAGWAQGTPFRDHTGVVRTAIRVAVRGAILADADALRDAPRLNYTDKGDQKHRVMTIKDAQDAMIEELDGMIE